MNHCLSHILHILQRAFPLPDWILDRDITALEHNKTGQIRSFIAWLTRRGEIWPCDGSVSGAVKRGTHSRFWYPVPQYYV